MGVASQDIEWGQVQEEVNPSPAGYQIVDYMASNGEVSFEELNREMDSEEVDIARSLSNLSDAGTIRQNDQEVVEYEAGTYERPTYCLDIEFVDF